MSACPGCEVEIADYVRHCGATWCAGFVAGRASVIESEDFKVVRDAARICAAHNDIEAFEVRVVAPFRSADQSAKAAAIRTALEAL